MKLDELKAKWMDKPVFCSYGIGMVCDVGFNPETGEPRVAVHPLSPDIEDPRCSWGWYDPESLTIPSQKELILKVRDDVKDHLQGYIQGWEWRLREFCYGDDFKLPRGGKKG